MTPIINWPLRPLSLAEYAAYHESLGTRIVKEGRVFWQRVRPGFYRPVTPYEPLQPAGVEAPRAAKWGGYQYAVSEDCEANSVLALLLFRNAPAYSLESLSKKRRWEVRSASQRFHIRLLHNASELVAAHSVYLDFLRRTRYRYRCDRAQAETFRRWAATVFSHEKVMVFGAWMKDELQAVSIALAVERTLIYASFFACEPALKGHVASLMLHTIRELAAQQGGIQQVYVGMRKLGSASSVDAFYLERGCELIFQPAYFQVHPLTARLLRTFRPGVWARITGYAYLKPSGPAQFASFPYGWSLKPNHNRAA